MTNPRKAGYIFQSEITDSLKALKETKYGKGLYYERIVDTKAYGVRCQRCRYPIYPNLILPKQPADHLFIIFGKICYLEEKSTRNDVSYNITWIKPHQLSMGFDIVAAGGHYYFLICKRVPFGMRLYALTPENLANAIMGMEFKTAIRWADVEKYSSFSLKRNTTDATWDLDPIVRFVKNGKTDSNNISQ